MRGDGDPVQLLNASELPRSDRARLFAGADHGPAGVTFFVINYPEPGIGPELHRHPYDETWLIQEGRVLLEIGAEQREAEPGTIAVAPARLAHKIPANQ